MMTMRRRWMKLTFETTVRELKCTLSMRRYSNDLEGRTEGTKVYERVFTTKGQGRYGKTKNSLAMQERIEAWIHVYTLIMLLWFAGGC